MSFIAIFFLAVGLAMDATAVAAAKGLATPVVRSEHVVRIMLFFGGFQALMPLLGWFLGSKLGPIVAAWDHWIAFVLLAGIGGKMLWEARGGDDDGDGDEASKEGDPFGLRVLLVLAVATSIDAFAVGITLPMIGAPMLLSLVTIGVVTALLSAAGLFLGRRFGALLGKRLDMVGGLVLIVLGSKILFDHLTA